MATSVTLKPNAIDISGSTSGTTTLQASAVAGTTTLTLPAATDTLVGKATTDTLTNKTLTTPTINQFSSAASTALTIQSAGTTAMTIDTSQNVGIGATPSAWNLGKAIEINTVGQGVWATSTATSLTNNYYYNSAYKFAGTGYASRVLLSGQFGSIDVSTASGTAGNNITFSSTLAFGYNQTVALQGATQTTGTGIAFPATQSASSDANTLDDYEEGTFTPAIYAGGSQMSGGTFNSLVGIYTKTGRVVNFLIDIVITTLGTGSGALSIRGLPFTGANNALYTVVSVESESLASAISNFVPLIPPNTAYMDLYYNWNGTGSPSVLQFSGLKNGSSFRISGFYNT